MRVEGLPTEDELRRLVEEARARGDDKIVVETTHEAGDAWIRAGFLETARSLEAPLATIEQHLAARKDPSLGSIHVQTDDVDAVVRAVRQFVPRLPGGSQGSVVLPPEDGWTAVYDELGDRDGQAFCLNDLGIVHQRQGDHALALACQRKSLAIRRELGDAHCEAESLRELGVTLRALGHLDEARAHWLEALATFERLQSANADQVRAVLAELPPTRRVTAAGRR